MTREASKSQQKRFAVQKDPKRLAKRTAVHQPKTVYRRSRAEINEYIKSLNEGYGNES